MYNSGGRSSPSNSGRPTGSISIPVEIVRDTTGGGPSSRRNSPFRTLRNEADPAATSSSYSNGGNTDSSPWASPRFQTRQSPSMSNERRLYNPQFNQPLSERPSTMQQQQSQYQHRHPQQQLYEPGSLHYSRSSEDLLSPRASDSMSQPSFQQSNFTSPYSPSSFASEFQQQQRRPVESEFLLPHTKYSNPMRRSFEGALNDFSDSFPHPFPSATSRFSDMPQSSFYSRPSAGNYPSQPQSTYTNQAFIQPNIVYTNDQGTSSFPPQDPYRQQQQSPYQVYPPHNAPNDRSRSPASQRGASPARPPPPQQPPASQEPIPMPYHNRSTADDELKMAKDIGPIPMPPPSSSHSVPPSTTDQQVPIDPQQHQQPAAAAPPQPPRDPNTIAIEKLDQFKQSLVELNRLVDEFKGDTRDHRSYKLLDEQALKIMMRCDELVDVNAEVKEKRKEMIRNVQDVLKKLEAKVPLVNNSNNAMDTSESALTLYNANNNAPPTAATSQDEQLQKQTSPPPSISTTSEQST